MIGFQRIGVYDLVSAFDLLSGIVQRLDPGYTASGVTLGDKVQDLAQRLECLVIEARRESGLKDPGNVG